MSIARVSVRPSSSPLERVRTLTETVRWAPAPRWGVSARERRRFAAYLSGSIVGWTLLGLAVAALTGQALGLVG